MSSKHLRPSWRGIRCALSSKLPARYYCTSGNVCFKDKSGARSSAGVPYKALTGCVDPQDASYHPSKAPWENEGLSDSFLRKTQATGTDAFYGSASNAASNGRGPTPRDNPVLKLRPPSAAVAAPREADTEAARPMVTRKAANNTQV